MNKYELTSRELEDFAKQVYERACSGYLDLKDATCISMVNNFLSGKKIISDDTNLIKANVELTSIDQNFYSSENVFYSNENVLRELNYIRTEGF